nr:protein-disulfide reductase DsbD [Hydrogenophilus thiooxidans]
MVRWIGAARAVLRAFAHLALTAVLLGALSFASAADPVPPEEAYPAEAYRLDAQTIAVEFTIRPDYYLYRDKIRVAPLTAGLQLGTPTIPPGKRKKDDFFGETEVFTETVQITVPVEAAPGDAEPWRIRVISQGCWNGGVCYPPLEQTLTVADAPPQRSWLGKLIGSVTSPDARNTLPDASPPRDSDAAPTEGSAAATDQAGAANAAPLSNAAASVAAEEKPLGQRAGSAQAGGNNPSLDEAGSLAAFLAQQNPATVLAAFFGFGLLLSFTPCVFPMIPILSGIIVGQGKTISRLRALGLTLTYVVAMAVTYALAGVAAGLTGTMVQAALQHPAVLVTFALLFVALALSLFGFYELQMPTRWQTRLNQLAGSQQGGQLIGVAVMGVLSALIVGPCVAPPLVGALLYISQTGDAVFGGAALFALGLGMGAPLIAVGVGARALLPKSGPWMNGVKAAMGVVMLALAWWLVRPVVADLWWLVGWAVLAVGTAVALGALEPLPIGARWPKRMGKALGLLLLAYGVAAFWGALAGNRDPLQPLAGFAGGNGGTATANRGALTFQPIGSVTELEAAVAKSTRPVLVDVRADWCVSCLELERYTFTDPQVVALLSNVTLLRMDVTENNARDQAFLRHFQIFGPPALLFFAPGNPVELRQYRITGFVDGPTFAAHLRKWLSE